MRFRRYTLWLRKWLTNSAGGLATKRMRLALLIDSDNVHGAGLFEVICGLEARFDLYYRRAYASSFNGGIESLGQRAIKPIQTFPSIHGRAATDIAITVDAMEEIERADVFCIASADADFSGLLQRLRERGKYVVVAGPGACTSAALRAVSNEFLPIDEPQSDRGAFEPGKGHLAAISNSNLRPGQDAHEKLMQDLTRTFHILHSVSSQPTMRALKAKHRDLNPAFRIESYEFFKGNPPTLQRVSNFVDLVRSVGLFGMTRVPGTRGPATDYFLTLR